MKRTSLLIAALLATAIPASAGTFELFGGYHGSDNFLVKEGSALGLRGGLALAGPWSAELSLSRVEGNASQEAGLQFRPEAGTSVFTLRSDQTLVNLELSFVRKLGETGWAVLGGPGWGFAENHLTRSFSGDSSVRFKARSDNFSLHAGVTGRFRLSDHAYLRPDLRIRWSDDVDLRFEGDANNFDTEASIGIGWKF